MNKTFRGSLATLFTVVSFVTIGAQGVHFSYLDFAPQHVNPANIGSFAGSYRGAAIYRDQYNNNGVRGYKDFEIGIDLPVINGFRKQDWIGVGMSINRDQRGTVKLTDTYSRMGLSYHFALNKKQTRVVTLGIQRINITHAINGNFDLAVSPEKILVGTNGDLENLLKGLNAKNQKSITASDWNIGLQYSQNSKTNSLKLGVSGSGFLPSKIAFEGKDTASSVPFRFISYLQLSNQINPKMALEPTALLQLTEFGGFEIMANAKVAYKLKKDSKDKVKAGLGFRTGTFSAIVLAGAEIKGINFGFSYDIPLSGYAGAPGIQNGFEFGASYIGFFKKRPKPKPVLLCPRL